MKKFLLILILTLSFQSWTKAEDIRDFQIEGMSIGDSALNYYTKDELNNGIKSYYPNKKFYHIDIVSKGSTYENIQFAFKQNDKNFKIYNVSGGIFFVNKPFSGCLKKQKEITKEITTIFDNLKINEGSIYNHPADKTGKSKKKDVEITFTNTSELILIDCIDWSKKITKEKKWIDNLGVGLTSKEFENWLRNKAFE
jgi:hypothetical protein